MERENARVIDLPPKLSFTEFLGELAFSLIFGSDANDSYNLRDPDIVEESSEEDEVRIS